MIRSDNHVHTSFSTDSDTPMEQMVLKGIELDLSSICFTDHIDYDFPDMGNGVEFLFDVDEYFAKLAALKESYPQFELRRGVEIGLKPDLTERCNALVHGYPFDFVIGSTHLVDNVDPYYPAFWEQYSEKEGIRRYYELTMENIKTGIDFDVYGHIDYIIRYTPTLTGDQRGLSQNFRSCLLCLLEGLLRGVFPVQPHSRAHQHRHGAYHKIPLRVSAHSFVPPPNDH